MLVGCDDGSWIIEFRGEFIFLGKCDLIGISCEFGCRVVDFFMICFGMVCLFCDFGGVVLLFVRMFNVL